MDELEQKVKQQAVAEAEVEDLSDVDPGLSPSAVIEIYAKERLQGAVVYQTLAVRLSTIKASIRANEAVGNPQAVEHFKAQEAEVERNMKHCLRGIKVMDKQCPEAKARMQDIERNLAKSRMAQSVE